MSSVGAADSDPPLVCPTNLNNPRDVGITIDGIIKLIQIRERDWPERYRLWIRPRNIPMVSEEGLHKTVTCV